MRLPPTDPAPAWLQTLRFGDRPMAFNLNARRRFGDVWQLKILSRKEPFVVTCHPDHIRSLLKAKPSDAPSLTGESPLRPILGPNSVLTSVGERHMRQRKMLLPPFHGEAVQRYVQMISEVAEREIDRWQLGRAVRARAPDAGGHARRDHERRVRDRGPPRPRFDRAIASARRSGG